MPSHRTWNCVPSPRGAPPALTSGMRMGRIARIFTPNANFSRYSLSFLRQNQFSQELQAVGNLAQLNTWWVLTISTRRQRKSSDTERAPLECERHRLHSQQRGRGGTGQHRPTRAMTRTHGSFSATVTLRPRATPSSGRRPGRPAFLDALHVTGGVRYGMTRRRRADHGQWQAVEFSLSIFQKGRVDPLVILAYDLSSDFHVYAKYSTGFRAGGANDRR